MHGASSGVSGLALALKTWPDGLLMLAWRMRIDASARHTEASCESIRIDAFRPKPFDFRY
jgi:hypothetical protein